MKILQVIPFLTPKRGGAITVCYNLSKGLANLGHDVTIITTDFEINLDNFHSLEKVKVISFKCVANLELFLYSPGMKKWLKSNISKFDIVHLHDFRTYQNTLVCKYARAFGIPYIVQPHGSLPRMIEKKRLKQLYDQVWGHDVLNHASTIVAVSEREFIQFRQFGISEKRLTIIPNGIKCISPNDLPPVGRFREQFKIREKHIILFVGRLHKVKGIEFLINAFKSFIQTWTGDEVVLVIVGPDDGYRGVLEYLVEKQKLLDKVKFIGYMSEVEAAYQDADVLVYPSIYEIFGLAPFEALFCGTPVIVTDDCGCGELIRKAECGYIVHYGDIFGLNEILKLVIEHPDVNRKMVEKGRQYISEHLTWERIVKQVDQMYKNCCHKPVDKI